MIRHEALTITEDFEWHGKPAYKLQCDCGRSCRIFADVWDNDKPRSCGDITIPPEEFNWQGKLFAKEL